MLALFSSCLAFLHACRVYNFNVANSNFALKRIGAFIDGTPVDTARPTDPVDEDSAYSGHRHNELEHSQGRLRVVAQFKDLLGKQPKYPPQSSQQYQIGPYRRI